MRRDLRPIRPGDEAAIELKLLTGDRAVGGAVAPGLA